VFGVNKKKTTLFGRKKGVERTKPRQTKKRLAVRHKKREHAGVTSTGEVVLNAKHQP